MTWALTVKETMVMETMVIVKIHTRMEVVATKTVTEIVMEAATKIVETVTTITAMSIKVPPNLTTTVVMEMVKGITMVASATTNQAQTIIMGA